MGRSSALGDFLRARPLRANAQAPSCDPWGVPTPQAVRDGFFRARPVDRRLVALFNAAPTPQEGWEALALDGAIPPGWVDGVPRFFSGVRVGSMLRIHPSPMEGELAAAVAADPLGTEDAEDLARQIVGHPAYAGPRATEAAWGLAHTRPVATRPVLSQEIIALLRSVTHSLPVAERVAITDRISDRLLARPDEQPLWGGTSLINAAYVLAHLWRASAKHDDTAFNPCLALLCLWERGYAFSGVGRFGGPGRARRYCLSFVAWSPRP